MVALAVLELGRNRVVCFAIDPLIHAREAIDAGDWLSGGVLLREALRRFLEAEVTYYDCWPAKKYDHTPKGFLIALKKAGRCDRNTFDVVCEIINNCNAVAHCRRVSPQHLEASAGLLLCMMESSPAIQLPQLRKGGAI